MLRGYQLESRVCRERSHRKPYTLLLEVEEEEYQHDHAVVKLVLVWGLGLGVETLNPKGFQGEGIWGYQLHSYAHRQRHVRLTPRPSTLNPEP